MGDIIVLKCGGSTIDDLSDQFFANIRKLQSVGLKPVIVHGGGPAIQEMLERHHIHSEFVDGLRKTTKQMMEIVEMTLSGKINNMVVRKLNQMGIEAVGLSGSDSQLLKTVPKNLAKYGYVGDVNGVNTTLLKKMLNLDIVPVIAPIGVDEEGTLYNINADTAAAAVAKSLEAKQLIFVTDVPGIMKGNRLLKSVTETELFQLIEDGVIYGGMIPKVKAAIASLSDHLKEVMIVDGDQAEISHKDQSLIGTVIKKEMEAKEHVSTFSNV